ncbi:MAG: hypothetical protein M3680_35760 [Myxococcota bacterium]|nr:hypothetical protein [Myxococcota bacterium]
MRPSTFIGFAFTALLTSACVDLSSESSQAAEGNFDRDECKIEGSEIGREGAKLVLGARTVTFRDWVKKPGSNGEYLGFSVALHGTSSVSYVVKAATKTYASSTKTWLHPGGNSANAISNVDFCGECEDGSCGPDAGNPDEDCNGTCPPPPPTTDCDDGGDGCPTQPSPDGPLT